MSAALLLAMPGAVRSQSIESDLTPESAQLGRPESEYAVPAIVSDAALESLGHVDGKDRYSFKLGIVLLPADYTTFDQDAASKAQVGNQRDEFEARSLRLSARGHFELFRRWNYLLSYEYKGFDQTSTADWNATDLRISTEIGPRAGTLSIGKIKEPHVYEMVGDSANLPHNERLLSPFFVSRNVGVQFANAVLDQRVTWAVGAYNDWTMKDTSFSDGGIDGVGRVTAVPVWEDEGRTYLHLGASFRYVDAADDELRYRGRPASNVADYYVDTGRLAGDHALHAGLEALVNVRNWSVLAEYVRADLDLQDGSDPTFDGWYVTGSWVVTGEHRPYDRKAGYARRILPSGRWGAVELVGRYGRVDLTDGSVEGGVMDGWWTGVNWWATRRFKASIGYGDVDLERGGIVGHTRTLLSRIQWIY